MIPNRTITRPLTPEEIAERQAFFEQSMHDADRVNAQFMIAGAQQREAEFQAQLVENTKLSLESLIAIREWLAANP
jgi:hypothetical protein